MPVDYDERNGSMPHAGDVFDSDVHSSHKDTCPMRNRYRKEMEDPPGF